jgi:SnoaL-like domain
VVNSNVAASKAETDPSDYESIRKVVEDWALLRDAGFWTEFESVWHDDGWMTATWFQGPFQEFIAASREGYESGTQISHFLGGFTCELNGDRAIAQTKMKIEQRSSVDGVDVDVTCTGRFYDFVERRDNRWAIVRRQPIYERDRLDVLDPTSELIIDQEILATFPTGYRHLGYVQQKAGQRVMLGLPGLRGPEVENLYDEGREWLRGSATAGTMVRNGI